MMNVKRCIILVTENWRGARQLALDLQTKCITVDLLIQERVSPDILEIISPKPLIQIKSWGRGIFSWLAPLWVLSSGKWKKTKIVVTDHKNYGRYRRLEVLLGYQTILLRMKNRNYVLSREDEPYELQNCLSL